MEREVIKGVEAIVRKLPVKSAEGSIDLLEPISKMHLPFNSRGGLPLYNGNSGSGILPRCAKELTHAESSVMCVTAQAGKRHIFTLTSFSAASVSFYTAMLGDKKEET